jgi:hypothetical protein
VGIRIRNPIKARGLEREILDVRTKAFQAACLDAKQEIIDRSQRRGQDYTGKTFVKYSESYARRRDLAGKRVSPPDLTGFNPGGEMLQALQVRFESLGNGRELAEFFFDTASAAKKARFVNELREFFRLSIKQLTEIKNRIRKATR